MIDPRVIIWEKLCWLYSSLVFVYLFIHLFIYLSTYLLWGRSCFVCCLVYRVFLLSLLLLLLFFFVGCVYIIKFTKYFRKVQMTSGKSNNCWESPCNRYRVTKKWCTHPWCVDRITSWLWENDAEPSKEKLVVCDDNDINLIPRL